MEDLRCDVLKGTERCKGTVSRSSLLLEVHSQIYSGEICGSVFFNGSTSDVSNCLAEGG